MLSKISKYFNKDSIYATPIRRIVSGVIDGLVITIFFNSYIYITTIIYNDSKPDTYNILNSNTLSNENINKSILKCNILNNYINIVGENSNFIKEKVKLILFHKMELILLLLG